MRVCSIIARFRGSETRLKIKSPLKMQTLVIPQPNADKLIKKLRVKKQLRLQARRAVQQVPVQARKPPDAPKPTQNVEGPKIALKNSSPGDAIH